MSDTNKPFLVKRTRTGLGLVACREYRKGDEIVEYTGELITRDEADRRANKYLFDINSKWTIDGAPRSNIGRYINHACKPNCEPEVDERKKRIHIYAIKRIRPGDELTYDYGKEYFDEYIKPNGCKCRTCAPDSL